MEDNNKEYRMETILNRLAPESYTSRYSGCIISHHSIIGDKIRPMLIMEVRRGREQNSFLVTALPISSKVDSMGGSFPIILNDNISYVLFLPETLLVQSGHFRHINQCRLSAVEFTACLDCMYGYYKRDPEITSILISRQSRLRHILNMTKAYNDISSDLIDRSRVVQPCTLEAPVEPTNDDTTTEPSPADKSKPVSKRKGVKKPKAKMVTPKIKTIEDCIEFLSVVSMYNSIRECHKFRYCDQGYVSTYQKIQKTITKLEAAMEQDENLQIPSNVKRVITQHKAKRRDK